MEWYLLRVQQPGTTEIKYVKDYAHNAERTDTTLTASKAGALRMTKIQAQTFGNVLYQRGWFVDVNKDED